MKTSSQFIAVLAPDFFPLNGPGSMHFIHPLHGHLNELLLREMTRATGVKLEGKLGLCNGCLLAKGLLRGPLPRETVTLAV